MGTVESEGIFTTLLNATLIIGGYPILWREIIGNLFGLASAVGGMKRVVWAWPVGIVGNVLLFTVFLGGVFHTPQDLDLYGQAGRQVTRRRRSGHRGHPDDHGRTLIPTPLLENLDAPVCDVLRHRQR